MNISLIASFYRVQAHLPTWITRAQSLAEHVKRAGITLEFVIVANNAQDDERTLIDAFAAHVSDVNVMYVPRESLYASWNRGVQAARGSLIGFWNADDARNTQAVLDAWRLSQSGAKLIYFPWTVIRLDAKGLGRHEQQVYSQIPFDAESQKRKFRAGPFFMFTPELYRQTGDFDARFRIIGDWEWCNRAMKHTAFTPSRVNGGEFYVHGGNLSNTGSTRQLCEENIMRILGGMVDDITPAPPDEMKTLWSAWEKDYYIRPELAEKLWGTGAAEEWARWQIEEPRRKAVLAREQQLRAIPKWLIDTFGLRPLLASLGIVKARPSDE